MAVADHILRFRMLSTEQLLEKQAALEARDSVYQSMTIGTKSMQLDLRLLNEQLNAIAFVLRERTPLVITRPPTPGYGVGVTDFSSIS